MFVLKKILLKKSISGLGKKPNKPTQPLKLFFLKNPVLPHGLSWFQLG